MCAARLADATRTERKAGAESELVDLKGGFGTAERKPNAWMAWRASRAGTTGQGGVAASPSVLPTATIADRPREQCVVDDMMSDDMGAGGEEEASFGLRRNVNSKLGRFLLLLN